jgi:hypothetical protein
MPNIIVSREGPLAIVGEDSAGRAIVILGENTAEARRQALLAKQAAEQTTPIVLSDEVPVVASAALWFKTSSDSDVATLWIKKAD